MGGCTLRPCWCTAVVIGWLLLPTHIAIHALHVAMPHTGSPGSAGSSGRSNALTEALQTRQAANGRVGGLGRCKKIVPPPSAPRAEGAHKALHVTPHHHPRVYVCICIHIHVYACIRGVYPDAGIRIHIHNIYTMYTMPMRIHAYTYISGCKDVTDPTLPLQSGSLFSRVGPTTGRCTKGPRDGVPSPPPQCRWGGGGAGGGNDGGGGGVRGLHWPIRAGRGGVFALRTPCALLL